MGRAGSGSRSSGGGRSRSSGSGGSRSRSSSSRSRSSSSSVSFGSSRSYSSSHSSYSSHSVSYRNTSPKYYGTTSKPLQYSGDGGNLTMPKTNTKFNNAIIISLILIIATILCITIYVGDGGPKSTYVREKIDSGYAFDINCIKDEIGWFDSTTNTGRSLRYFYEKTGIQPFIYLKSYDPSLQTGEAQEEYAAAYYETNFGSRSDVFLYIYFAEKDADNDVGDEAWWIGNQASSVMDAEAFDIFWHKLDALWYTDISTDKLFVTTFEHTADKIMHVDRGPWFAIAIVVTVAGVMSVLVFTISYVKEKNRRAKEEAEETIKILNADINELAKSTEEEILVDKYT